MKKFNATWGKGYEPKAQSVTESFFCWSNGYNQQDINAIQKLAVGATIELNDSGEHSITRTE